METNRQEPRPWRRWLAQARRPRRLQLIESLPLGERRLLALVAVDGRELLLGVGPQSVTLVGEAGEPAARAKEGGEGAADCA